MTFPKKSGQNDTFQNQDRTVRDRTGQDRTGRDENVIPQNQGGDVFSKNRDRDKTSFPKIDTGTKRHFPKSEGKLYFLSQRS